MREKTDHLKETEGQRGQYIFTLVITLIALMIIVCYSFGSFYRIAKEDAVALGEKSVSEESEKLNNFLLKGMDVVQVTGLTVDYMLQTGTTSGEIRQYLMKESESYAEQIDASFTGIYGVFNGVYIDGSGWEPDDDYIPQQRPWYINGEAGKGRPVIVSPYLDAKTNSIMISISQRLSDRKSVVALDIVMDDMQKFAEEMSLNGSGYGFIIDGNGLVVAHSDKDEKGKNYLEDIDVQGTEIQELAEKIISAKGKTIQSKLNGENCSVFSKVVQGNWYVVMVVDTGELFEKVQGNLLRNIFISLLIFAVVVYFCTSTYRNRMKAMHYAEKIRHYQQTLEERVAKQTEEIKGQAERMLQMQDNVIEGMATLIESRDGNTGEHVRSTKKYVSLIVNYMYDHHMHSEEVDLAFVERLTNAAALHDVGKIKISDTILNKPGKLTTEEFDIMKTHSNLGGDIVETILGKNADEQLVQISGDVARYHHEKWDGSGYPDGLKGEEIPLSARIMAVADVFDALVSKRVYKDKVPVEKAFDILMEESGSHFDPEIVEIFMTVRSEVEQYLKEI